MFVPRNSRHETITDRDSGMPTRHGAFVFSASTPAVLAAHHSSFLQPRGMRRPLVAWLRRRLVAPAITARPKRATPTACAPSPSAEKRLEVPDVKRLAQLFWRLALPYWKRNKDARRDLAGVLVLTLLQSGIAVAFSFISKDFWNALNTKDSQLFLHQAGLFFGALCVFTPIVVYYQYFRDRCALKWRDWLTQTILQQYVTNRNFYNLDQNADIRVDNPDQRIAQDLSSFTYESLAFVLTVLVSCIDLVAFSSILFSIYPPLFGVLVAYAATGTALTSSVGKKLVGLNYVQLVREADFRYSLIRFRDNAESVAFFAGEKREQTEITRRLSDVVDNLTRVIGLQRNLGFLQTGYRYLVQVLPALVVAPLYFNGLVQLGTVTQSFGAFSHVLNDLSLVVNRFDQLSQFGAGIERLGEFVEALEKNLEEQDRTFGSLPTAKASSDTAGGNGVPHTAVEDAKIASNSVTASNGVAASNGAASSNGVASTNGAVKSTPATEQVIELRETSSNELIVRNLSLYTPSGGVPRRLIDNLSFTLEPGQRLLVAGPSGVGKSSLLRAISGLWTNGTGIIERPSTDKVFFLPQRPYCTLGTLRANMLYPRDDDANAPSDDVLLSVLKEVNLQELPGRMGGFNAIRDWGDTLSLGEQQRLQFARLLLAKPRMAVIDEGSAALSIDAERRMYNLLESMGITVVSIGHRPSLLKYHDVLLRLSGDDAPWELERIEQKMRDRVVAQVL